MSLILDLILGRVQPQFDNDNDSLATTSFVQRALGNHQAALTFSGPLVLSPADAGKVFIYAEPANITVTLPDFATSAVGSVFELINTGPNIVTVTRAGTDQIDQGTATVDTLAIPPHQSLRIIRADQTMLWHAVTITAAPVATPPQFDADLSLATTLFVQRALGNYQGGETFTGPLTVLAGDAGKVNVFSGSSPQTATLPLIADVPAGAAFEFINTGTAALTVSRAGTDQIDNGPASVTSIAVPPNQSLRLVRVLGSSLWHVVTFPAASLAGAFASTLATPGNIQLPNGFILQWGSQSVAANTATAVTLATPTAQNFGALVTVANAGTADTGQGGYSALTPTSITLVNSQNAARTLFYAVLGRLTT